MTYSNSLAVVLSLLVLGSTTFIVTNSQVPVTVPVSPIEPQITPTALAILPSTVLEEDVMTYATKRDLYPKEKEKKQEIVKEEIVLVEEIPTPAYEPPTPTPTQPSENAVEELDDYYYGIKEYEDEEDNYGEHETNQQEITPPVTLDPKPSYPQGTWWIETQNDNLDPYDKGVYNVLFIVAFDSDNPLTSELKENLQVLITKFKTQVNKVTNGLLNIRSAIFYYDSTNHTTDELLSQGYCNPMGDQFKISPLECFKEFKATMTGIYNEELPAGFGTKFFINITTTYRENGVMFFNTKGAKTSWSESGVSFENAYSEMYGGSLSYHKYVKDGNEYAQTSFVCENRKKGIEQGRSNGILCEEEYEQAGISKSESADLYFIRGWLHEFFHAFFMEGGLYGIDGENVDCPG
ncbi:MAG: hypothetical protein GOV15_01255, partial [Candidatus Diapherotrites archaeon]|nr:hypothetical protein [Candidatus Diapherotrites archaeon]